MHSCKLTNLVLTAAVTSLRGSPKFGRVARTLLVEDGVTYASQTRHHLNVVRIRHECSGKGGCNTMLIRTFIIFMFLQETWIIQVNLRCFSVSESVALIMNHGHSCINYTSPPHSSKHNQLLFIISHSYLSGTEYT